MTASPSALMARIIASRTVVASVVKRAASEAGASRSSLREVRLDEVGEHALLQLADDHQHQALQHDGLAVLRPPPSRW